MADNEVHAKEIIRVSLTGVSGRLLGTVRTNTKLSPIICGRSDGTGNTRKTMTRGVRFFPSIIMSLTIKDVSFSRFRIHTAFRKKMTHHGSASCLSSTTVKTLAGQLLRRYHTGAETV